LGLSIRAGNIFKFKYFYMWVLWCKKEPFEWKYFFFRCNWMFFISIGNGVDCKWWIGYKSYGFGYEIVIVIFHNSITIVCQKPVESLHYE